MSINFTAAFLHAMGCLLTFGLFLFVSLVILIAIDCIIWAVKRIIRRFIK